MSSTVSNFISKLDKLNSNNLEVFIPSQKKTVKVKSLNLKQQKDLISSVLDGIKGSLDFTKTLNKIIIDNSGLDDLKLYDKLPFIISMRKDSLGNEVQRDDSGKVELQKIIDSLKNTPFQLKDEKVVKYENLKIGLKVPTLKEEITLLTKSERDIDSKDDEFKDSVGTLYLLEIVKYIQSLEIDEEVIDMSVIRISERMKLIEKLPLAVYKDISKFIQRINKYERDVLTVDDYVVSINSIFFDSGSDE